MDQRLSAAALGGVLGVVLVVLVAIARPPGTAGPGNGIVGPGVGGPAPSVSFPPRMGTADIYRSFEDLGRAESAGERVDLSVVRAGELVLPSGGVLASDVFLFGQPAFSRSLPPGRHPVFLLRIESDEWDDVAAAMLRAAPGDPVRWEPATIDGVDPGSLDPASFASYGVDSGTAAFTSPEVAQRLDPTDDALWEAYGDELTRQMFPAPDESALFAEIVLDPVSGANVIAFRSGWGDGGYPAWFGLDANGEPIVLLTDFGILDAPKT